MNTVPTIDRFRRTVSLTSRYGDLDADNLLSETALLRYLEQARSHALIELLKECDIDLQCEDSSIGMLIAHVSVEILRHATPGPEIRLASCVSRIGTSSVQLQVGIFSEGHCLAVADNVLVFIARATGRPTELPAILRERLQAAMCA